MGVRCLGRMVLLGVVALSGVWSAPEARAATVLCWGGGIPCFHVSTCGGYPACTGGNQPCCLGGSATAFGGAVGFSDVLVASTGLAVTDSLELTSELPGTAVLELYSAGKQVSEQVIPIAVGQLPTRLSLTVDGVAADFFRLYFAQTVASVVTPKGTERAAVLMPTLTHLTKARAGATGSQRQAIVQALGALQQSRRLAPDLALSMDGTAQQCR